MAFDTARAGVDLVSDEHSPGKSVVEFRMSHCNALVHWSRSGDVHFHDLANPEKSLVQSIDNAITITQPEPRITW